MKGELEGIGTVWVNEDIIANILGFSDLKKKFFIKINTQEEDVFVCTHKITKKTIRFPCTDRGLYELQMSSQPQSNTKKQRVSMPQTLKESIEGFSELQVARAKKARALQHMLGVSN